MKTSGPLGSFVSLGLLVGKAASSDTMTDEGVDDRAYRIANNAGQNKVDSLSMYGLLAGGAIGVFSGRLLSCSSTGVAVGTAMYICQRVLEKRKL